MDMPDNHTSKPNNNKHTLHNQDQDRSTPPKKHRTIENLPSSTNNAASDDKSQSQSLSNPTKEGQIGDSSSMEIHKDYLKEDLSDDDRQDQHRPTMPNERSTSWKSLFSSKKQAQGPSGPHPRLQQQLPPPLVPVAPPHPIVAFYEGTKRDSKQRWLKDILKWDSDRLEYNHDYIQWLFPLPEKSGANWDAPTIDRQCFEAFQAQPELRARLRDSFVTMLRFYGLRMLDKRDESGEVILIKGPNFEKASRSWRREFDHNHLRITRIIRCLRILGLEAEGQAFYLQLMEFSQGGRDFGTVGDKSRMYWRRAAFRRLNLAPEISNEQCIYNQSRGHSFLLEFETQRAHEPQATPSLVVQGLPRDFLDSLRLFGFSPAEEYENGVPRAKENHTAEKRALKAQKTRNGMLGVEGDSIAKIKLDMDLSTLQSASWWDSKSDPGAGFDNNIDKISEGEEDASSRLRFLQMNRYFSR